MDNRVLPGAPSLEEDARGRRTLRELEAEASAEEAGGRDAPALEQQLGVGAHELRRVGFIAAMRPLTSSLVVSKRWA